ncbi:hypothetical protein DKX38_008060 [Salix brachista]|uniref:PH domain-containing protein n=1 Tax=Salix brachista TaxID=2182728 RepID=A0A5N5MSC6_9ROSI|nr:hypothetical protein DKX38_008060 [Salix brachista]
MHPLCCISTVSDNSPANLSMAVTARSNPNPGSTIVQPHNQNHNNNSGHFSNHHHHNHSTASNCSSNSGKDSNNDNRMSHQRVSSAREQPHIQVDVKINDIVGNGISGILYKWVNYGKGWRPRWFVLQDGVLSYFKIHGPDKILVNQETEKGSKVIGEESMRRMSRPKNGNSMNRRKPVGEIHLKVSSIRESRSDDKRFSIFTGTKRLHLRAEIREDRLEWMEALQAVKDMFPRMSNSELMAPMDNVAVSNELRKRLQEEGVREEVIQESEQIMRSEFAALQNQRVLLKQKQWLLTDTLRQLEDYYPKSHILSVVYWETEKVDLENTVVDESQRQLNDLGTTSSIMRQYKFSEASVSESDDDNERVDGAEEETDDDENVFFDTRDFLSSGSFKSIESDFRTSSFSSDDEGFFALESEDGIDPLIRCVGSNHPYIKRRKKLPDPIEKEKGVSLWSMIKDNIGKDLTKVCLPVYFNEPLSSLQKCFEDLEYSYLLDRAYEWGKQVSLSIGVCTILFSPQIGR